MTSAERRWRRLRTNAKRRGMGLMTSEEKGERGIDDREEGKC